MSFLSNDKGWKEVTLAGEGLGQTLLWLVPASLAACWKLAAGSGRLIFPSLNLRYLCGLRNNIRRKDNTECHLKWRVYSFLHIPLHTKACFLICSCFYWHNRGYNSCRNQTFWFYWLLTLFSNQCPDISKQYPSILEQYHYSDNSNVMLNMECMLFFQLPPICKMEYR